MTPSFLSEAPRRRRADTARQMADVLRCQVLDGVFPDGVLPSEERLLTEFATSRNTVRVALDLLRSEGLVERWPGVGTVVESGCRPSAAWCRWMPCTVSPEPLGRAAALEACAGVNGHGRLAATCVAAVVDPSWQVRTGAAGGLAGTAEELAVPSLLPCWRTRTSTSARPR